MSPASAILRKFVYFSLRSIKRCRRSCGLTKSVMLTHDARLQIVISICRFCYAQMTQTCDKMLCIYIYVLFSHYMIVFSFARPTCIQNVYDGFNFYCRNKTFAKYMILFYSKSLPVQIQYMNPVKLKTKQNSPVKHPKHTFNSVFGRLANSISSFHYMWGWICKFSSWKMFNRMIP